MYNSRKTIPSTYIFFVSFSLQEWKSIIIQQKISWLSPFIIMYQSTLKNVIFFALKFLLIRLLLARAYNPEHRLTTHTEMTNSCWLHNEHWVYTVQGLCHKQARLNSLTHTNIQKYWNCLLKLGVHEILVDQKYWGTYQYMYINRLHTGNDTLEFSG